MGSPGGPLLKPRMRGWLHFWSFTVSIAAGGPLNARGAGPGGVAALVLILVGGLIYTVGAVFYATRRPNPWPATFGYHEFFHAATVVAAICHHVAIWLILF